MKEIIRRMPFDERQREMGPSLGYLFSIERNRLK